MSNMCRIPVAFVTLLLTAAAASHAADPPATRPAAADTMMDACTAQLQEIGRALSAYERDHHHLPDQLSDLFPDYIKDKQRFHCPADPTKGTPGRDFAHKDPKLPCSYSYEFSADESRGLPTPLGPFPKPDVGNAWGTWRHMNTHEAYFFGDQVPVVRCFHHKTEESDEQKVLNLTRGGRIYRFTGIWEDHPDSVAEVLRRVDRDLAAGSEVFAKNWSIGRLREYTSGKAAEPAYTSLKPLFRQAAGHLIDDAERLPEKYNRTAYALAANYLNGTGDYAQAIDAIRRAVRAAVKDGDYAPDKADGDKWNFPAESLAASYHGLGQYELELPLMLTLHNRNPKVELYTRRIAEIHKALGQEEVAARWLDKAEPSRTLVGKQAPDFGLPSPSGGAELTPKALLRGKKALLVNFWFYACGPCRAEAPNLQGMYRDLKDKGLEVVAINQGDTPQNVAKFVEQYKLTFPVAMGGKPTDAKGNVFADYGVRGYPTNYLLDATGKIVWYTVGYEQEELDRLRKELEKLGVK